MEMQEQVGSRAQARLSGRKRKVTYFIFKRVTDIVISFFLLLVLSPLLWFISNRIKKREGAPILDRKICAGKGKHPFIMYRFRTMTNPSMVIRAIPLNPDLSLYTSSSNTTGIVTATGVLLKRYHLDMLPQLCNVLKGEMSLVGPSPKIIEGTSSHYVQVQVKPGMTGYAQVFGNTQSSAQFRKNADQYYVENCSYRLDMLLLFKTLVKLCKRNPKSF